MKSRRTTLILTLPFEAILLYGVRLGHSSVEDPDLLDPVDLLFYF
jgi:hypothetical protein